MANFTGRSGSRIRNAAKRCGRYGTLSHTINTARTWHILRALIDPFKTKRETNKALVRVLHTFGGTEAELLDKARDKCFGNHLPMGQYKGAESPTLDRPIMKEEVYAAIRNITKNTAPGTNRIANAIIRNLGDEAIQELTEFINDHWEAETVPAEWKHAEVILIPKPGKKLVVSNKCLNTRN